MLLLVLDTVRADELGAYGYARRHVGVHGSAGGRGALFSEAVATAPWTLPTHVSLLTGQYPHDTTVSWTRGLDGTHRTLAEVLASQGFRTGGFVANLEYASSAVGLDRGLRDLSRCRPRVRSRARVVECVAVGGLVLQQASRPHVLSDPAHGPEDVNDDFLRWLDEDPQTPFFAFLNYFDAHSPYSPPPPYDLKFADREPETRDLPVRGGRARPRPKSPANCATPTTAASPTSTPRSQSSGPGSSAGGSPGARSSS